MPMTIGLVQMDDRWDEDKFQEDGLRRAKRNYIKIAKVSLMMGLVSNTLLGLYCRCSFQGLE